MSTAQSADSLSNYVTFNLGWRSVEIPHYESSNATGFIPFNDKLTIPVFSLRMGLEKEILADQYVSFTPQVFGGLKIGRKKADRVVENVSFADKVSGSLYGFGGTVNANFKYGKTMRVQPFAGINIVTSDTKYRFSYTPYNASTPQVNFDYEEKRAQSYLIGGVRIFDNKQELFSIFTVEYEFARTVNSFSSVGKINGEKIDHTNTPAVDHGAIGASLGFGLMF